jgi:hypothetical protein
MPDFRDVDPRELRVRGCLTNLRLGVIQKRSHLGCCGRGGGTEPFQFLRVKAKLVGRLGSALPNQELQGFGVPMVQAHQCARRGDADDFVAVFQTLNQMGHGRPPRSTQVAKSTSGTLADGRAGVFERLGQRPGNLLAGVPHSLQGACRPVAHAHEGVFPRLDERQRRSRHFRHQVIEHLGRIFSPQTVRVLQQLDQHGHRLGAAAPQAILGAVRVTLQGIGPLRNGETAERCFPGRKGDAHGHDEDHGQAAQ